ncbi:hypothetical protein [Amycolatopsis sp. CA-230715]|uniref:hypothetical protein n=1 Tax=Amycolatopsis sp. CA-230715 TaxID=2745196 RepID=UPI001C01AE6D|nr:hypothetical protein [Amycolatopsis sp. CA-230715]QWF85080.1 hypothetical protein HUW46_08533 [Amycolatopsis sp. CA-230715]
MSPTPEIASALRDGPFSKALELAVRASGLSLRQLQNRLFASGVRVSVVTLSYWQSGRSLPERPQSLRGVDVLEVVLDLPPGSLRGLLGPRRPRGRGVWSDKPVDRLCRAWDYPAFLPSLLDGFGDRRLRPVTRLGLRETLHVGSDRCARRMVVEEFIEARHDGTVSVTIANRSRRGARPLQVTATSRCRPGPTLELGAEGFSVVELVLDRPLARGQRAAIRYQLEYPDPVLAEHHHRRVAEPVAAYRGRVVFSARETPIRCETWRRRSCDGLVSGISEVSVDSDHSVRVVRANLGLGAHGLRWAWDGENPPGAVQDPTSR